MDGTREARRTPRHTVVVLGVSLLLGGALLMKDQAGPLAIVATCVSVFGVSAEFIRGRKYYIDKLME